MELVPIPSEDIPPPRVHAASLPPSRWYSPIDIKLEHKVPDLNTRLARIWNTYKQGEKYVVQKAQTFHNTNGMNVRKAGGILFGEQRMAGPWVAAGIAISFLLAFEGLVGARWMLRRIGRKMAEAD